MVAYLSNGQGYRSLWLTSVQDGQIAEVIVVVQVRIEWNDKIKQIKTKKKIKKDENIKPGFRPEVVLIYPQG